MGEYQHKEEGEGKEEESEERVEVAYLSSPILQTPINIMPRFAGMYYMKLLSKAQAIEWILHDAFIPFQKEY